MSSVFVVSSLAGSVECRVLRGTLSVTNWIAFVWVSSSACSFFCFFGLKREKRFLLQVGYLAGFVGSIALDCVGLARWLKSLFITPTFSWNIVTA